MYIGMAMGIQWVGYYSIHPYTWMAIRPRSDGHPQKIPVMGRVKPRFHGYGVKLRVIGAGMGT
ncbi:hypothetical protein MTR_7g091360 [Medicago truncatula]|uniref:Uncharacterized protein n=1 Tax=Medicago truncatula TaxID=3880 RepID=G7KTH5_MEDTR|nr:hypothetical protein MTR_7g091360 [Medicago truncatula]